MAYSVTVHDHDRGAVDITDAVQSVDITEQVHQPWGSVVLTLRTPWKSRQHAVAENGSWVVVSNGGVALGWGIVDSSAAGMRRDARGEARSEPGRVNVRNWLDYMSRQSIIVQAGGGDGVGTRFGPREWAQIVKASALRGQGEIGRALAIVFANLARLRLPESLGGGILSEEIPVIFDEATRRAVAPDITVDPVYGPTPMRAIEKPAFGQLNVLSVLTKGTAGDQRMVELMPSVSRGGLTSGLGEKLGGLSPVLVHRMRPWRSHPLSDLAFHLGLQPVGGDLGQRFDRQTWPTRRAFRIPRGLVAGWSGTQTMRDHYTAVTVGLPSAPDSPAKWMRRAGLPLVFDAGVERYGLRVLDIDWPWFTTEAASQASVMDILRLVAAQGAQWWAGAGRFMEGAIRCHRIVGAWAGESFRADLVGWRRLTGYAHTVEHSLRRQRGGGWSESTTVSYGRGLVTSQDGDDLEFRRAPFVGARPIFPVHLSALPGGSAEPNDMLDGGTWR